MEIHSNKLNENKKELKHFMFGVIKMREGKINQLLGFEHIPSSFFFGYVKR